MKLTRDQAEIVSDALKLARPHPCYHPKPCQRLSCEVDQADRAVYQAIIDIVDGSSPVPKPGPSAVFTCSACKQENFLTSAWRDVNNLLYCYGCYTS